MVSLCSGKVIVQVDTNKSINVISVMCGQMLGRTAEALCLEVRRPLRPTSTRAHRKAFSLDYGSRRQDSPAGHRGRSPVRGNVDMPQPEEDSSSSSDSGMISPVPATMIQDPGPSVSSVSRGITGSNLDLGLGCTFHRSGGQSSTSSSSEQDVGVEDLGRSSLGSSLTLGPPAGERRLNKGERNRMKSVRRRQKRRERWRQRETQGNVQVRETSEILHSGGERN